MSTKKIISYLPYIAWFQAWIAMLGSLFFSEILKLPPCLLCWYQRILMYPLVVIIGVGILRKDLKNLAYYVLPFSVIGALVAFYQVLLQQGIIPESAAPCIQGVSCTTKQIELLGFITIPLLSFAAFLLITLAMLIYWKSTSHKSES